MTNATNPTAAGPVVTTDLATDVFSDQQQASMIGAAAAVAEQDATQDEAIETFVKVLGKAPTLVMYSTAQALFQKGYHDAMPDMSTDALAKRTTRFFSEVLKAGGITKPKAETVTSKKKAEQRAAQKQAMVNDPRTPDQISAEIKSAYAALANETAANPAETRKSLRELEATYKIKTAAENDALEAQLNALRSTLRDLVKTCRSPVKLADAIRALK